MSAALSASPGKCAGCRVSKASGWSETVFGRLIFLNFDSTILFGSVQKKKKKKNTKKKFLFFLTTKGFFFSSWQRFECRYSCDTEWRMGLANVINSSPVSLRRRRKRKNMKTQAKNRKGQHQNVSQLEEETQDDPFGRPAAAASSVSLFLKK